MACIDFDIQQLVSNQIRSNRIPGLDFDAVYFADDTILFSSNPAALNQLIALTETVSGKYGLKLNRSKCNTTRINNAQRIKFDDGTMLKNQEAAKYLGCDLNSKVDYNREVRNKIQETKATWMKLQVFWKGDNSHSSTRWKSMFTMLLSELNYYMVLKPYI